MKVGDYVRTKYGIGKIDEDRDFIGTHELHLDSNKGRIHNVTDNTYWITNEDIIKSSPNIIDLVEAGDYVNGHKVLDIAEAPKRVLYLNDISQKCALIPRENIKSIVTKEQFSQMEYRIGE